MRVIRLVALNQVGNVSAFDGLLTGLCNALLQPGFHFTLQPAGATSELDGFRKLPELNKLVEPFVRQAGELGDKRHIDKLIGKKISRCGHRLFSVGDKGEEVRDSKSADFFKR